MTEDDLYREICRNPEDDTLRLAYADWLEEQPAPVVRCPHCRHGEHVRRCHRCHGVVRDESEHHSGEMYDGTWLCDRTAACPRCGGSGSTADTEGADRAELIRLQVRQAVMMREYDAQSPLPEGHPAHAEWLRLSKLRHGITVRYPQWYLLPCGECGGKGRVPGASVYGYSREMEPCDICAGTGDLFLTPGVSGASLTPPPKPRAVTFARGFPDSVSCTMAEAFAPDGTPTAWAMEVARSTPVTRFILTNRTPLEQPGSGNRFRWWGDRPEIGRTINLCHVLPHPLFAHLKGESKQWEYLKPSSFCWEYATSESARAALAVAAGRLIRKHVYGEVA